MTAGVISQPATRQKGEIRLINEPSCAILVPPILAARRYVSPRSRPITPEESETRRIAYALKRSEETEMVAREMAGLLPPDLPTLTLVPVPASTGSLEANLILARAIAVEYGPQARVVPALRRSVPVESSCARRRRGLPGLTAADHAFVRVGGGSPCRCSSWTTSRQPGLRSLLPAMPSGLERASFLQTPHPSTSRPPNEPPKPDKRQIRSHPDASTHVPGTSDPGRKAQTRPEEIRDLVRRTQVQRLAGARPHADRGHVEPARPAAHD